MTTLNTDRLRLDFPILSRKIHGKPLVYLDNAATTQKPMSVIMAMTAYYERTNANVHRGVHTLSQEATSLMEQSRDKVAAFIGAPDPATVIFTRNATESINLVAYAWARKNLKPGDEILLTEMEHHSNLIPWQMAAQATGAVLRFIPVTGWDGLLDLSRLDALLTPRTKLLAVTQMSNVLGTINPVTELAKRAHAVGAKVLVDGAQAAPHLAVDVKTLGADFFAFSAHKMLGPTGLGVLWAPRALLESMDPFLGGGGHDQPSLARPRDVERTALQVRGRDAEHHRGHRLRCGHRLFKPDRHGQHPRPREGHHRLRPGGAQGPFSKNRPARTGRRRKAGGAW